MFDSIKEYLSPELLSEASKIYGENEIGIFKATTSLVPTILAGLLEKSGDSHTIDYIFSSLKNYDASILNNLGSLLESENQAQKDPRISSGQLLSTLFGAKIPAISNAVASFSGVKQTTALSLLDLAGPMVMALLSQKIKEEGLNASTLVSYLLRQRNTIISLLPAGVGSLLGMANIDRGNNFGDAKSSGNMGWLWLLLLVFVVLAVAVYYLAT